jgi:hypothetical protein
MDSSDHSERRQRHRVQLEADLIHPDGSTTQTIVSDLSLEGCRVAGWFLIGDTVTLRIPKIGDVRGQVRWALNGRAGLRFLSGLSG